MNDAAEGGCPLCDATYPHEHDFGPPVPTETDDCPHKDSNAAAGGEQMSQASADASLTSGTLNVTSDASAHPRAAEESPQAPESPGQWVVRRMLERADWLRSEMRAWAHEASNRLAAPQTVPQKPSPQYEVEKLADDDDQTGVPVGYHVGQRMRWEAEDTSATGTWSASADMSAAEEFPSREAAIAACEAHRATVLGAPLAAPREPARHMFNPTSEHLATCEQCQTTHRELVEKHLGVGAPAAPPAEPGGEGGCPLCDATYPHEHDFGPPVPTAPAAPPVQAAERDEQRVLEQWLMDEMAEASNLDEECATARVYATKCIELLGRAPTPVAPEPTARDGLRSLGGREASQAHPSELEHARWAVTEAAAGRGNFHDSHFADYLAIVAAHRTTPAPEGRPASLLEEPPLPDGLDALDVLTRVLPFLDPADFGDETVEEAAFLHECVRALLAAQAPKGGAE